MGGTISSRALILAAGLTLAACSGGGGGSSSPPPSPPPPSASGPDAVVVADRAAVDERQPLDIDAGGSSDPSGANLDYEIEQIAGPQLNLLQGSGPLWTFNTEEVDADTTVTFRVTVSFNGLSDSADVSATITNYDRTPLSQQWTGEYGDFAIDALSIVGFDRSVFQDADRLVFENPEGHVGVASFQTDPDEYPGVVESQILRDERISFDALFDDFNLDTQVDVAILDRTNDAITVYRQTLDDDDGFTFEETGSGNFANACALVSALVGDDRPAGFGNEYPGLFLGSEGAGFGIFLNSGNPRPFPNNATAQSLDQAGRFSALLPISAGDTGCHLAAGDLGSTGARSVWAYDDLRSELLEFLVPVGSVPALGRTVALGIGGQNIRMINMEFGVGQGGQGFLVMLFGRGHYDSNFLLVLQQDGATISQTRIDLPNGLGSDLLVDNVDYFNPGVADPTVIDFDSDIVVAVPFTPYLYVLENLSSDSGPVTFSEPQFLEVGFGVTRIGLVRGDDAFGPELALGDENGNVRLWQNAE